MKAKQRVEQEVEQAFRKIVSDVQMNGSYNIKDLHIVRDQLADNINRIHAKEQKQADANMAAMEREVEGCRVKQLLLVIGLWVLLFLSCMLGVLLCNKIDEVKKLKARDEFQDMVNRVNIQQFREYQSVYDPAKKIGRPELEFANE